MSAAIKYAEDNLGVHEIHAKAEAACNELDGILTGLSNKRDDRRQAEANLEDIEMEISIAERAAHPEMSATAFKDHLKAALFKTKAWKELRQEIIELVNEIEGLEYDRSIKTRDIEIAVARMTELGGYLNYLAAIKTASLAGK